MKAARPAEPRRSLRGLYAITPETGDLGRLLEVVGQALHGGARLVQYRAKHLPARLRQKQAEALLEQCRARAALLIVNDDLELATCLGADGVHLGRDDGDPRAARERLPHAILGVSCYDDPQRAAAAAAAGADYVGIGSVFASPTKPLAVRASLAILAQARHAAGVPVAAIGGITIANAGQAAAAGADMIAVLSALFDAPDVAAAARALSRPFAIDTETNVRAQPTTL